MSDETPFPGYERAPDGRWYPSGSVPEAAGEAQVEDPQPGSSLDPPAPRRKRPKRPHNLIGVWLAVAVLIGIAGGRAAYVSFSGSHTNGVKHTIIYSVTGSGTADISYDLSGNPLGNASRANGVSLPWKLTITDSTLGSYNLAVLLENGTTVACTLTIDGHVISTQNSIGPGAAISCQNSYTG
jgi:hypothetical protein